MVWHIAVHPDYYRQGIGEQLLQEAEKRAINLGLNRFEAWTRDDYWVQNWYEKMKVIKVDSYYHIYFEGNEMKNHIKVPYLNST
jgi:ribosomal protein S18 acetylase RimI-like enzyme